MTLRSRFILLLPILIIPTIDDVEASTTIPALFEEAKVIRDADGIPHILAQNEHDLMLLQGWVHARDRLFQMDMRRRQAAGTLSELLGPEALPADVELRTLGVYRAAERSWPVLSPHARAALEAYAEGVNAWIDGHPLPPEYGALEITAIDPWTALDSLAVAKLLTFGLAFDLGDIERTVTLLTYQAAGNLAGFDGTALFFEDVHRSAPFDAAATVPDSGGAPAVSYRRDRVESDDHDDSSLRPETREMGRKYVERIRRLKHVREIVRFEEDDRGSNEWAVSGQLTASGGPLMANDPHLAVGTPSTFYQNHLRARDDGFDVIGSSFAGAPFVVVGHNRDIAWGATIHPMDVTDVYQEQVVPDPASPSGLSTVHRGTLEPVIPLPQLYRVNRVGDGVLDNIVPVPPSGGVPPAVLVVPRRNQGPIVQLDPATGLALSVQFTGFSGTREIDTFRTWNRAEDLDDFIRGLQFFDFGSENWAYADTEGNIAYFTSAEMPVREDLQAGFVAGLPPFFIRNGTGGNEWLPVRNPQPGQAIPYEILPFSEMPQVVNPVAGYFVNANNDPAGLTLDNDPLNQLRPGGGIFYLAGGYDIGIRAGRVTRLIEAKLAEGRLLTADDMAEIQADVVQPDAEFFVPFIVGAFERAGRAGAHPAAAALAADPRVVEAVGRLRDWDRSTPTGVPEGYDAGDVNGERLPPGPDEVANSIAATIYNVWRDEMLANTIDAVLGAIGLPKPEDRRAVTALRQLFVRFDSKGGVGASGLNFFNVPGVTDAASRRDIVVLRSLVDALDALAGPEFAAAFAGSPAQDDYRWGRLHRITLGHPLGGPFSTPPAGGAVQPSFADLGGLAVDGGFEVVDASRPNAQRPTAPVAGPAFGDRSERFTFGATAPTRRFVAEVDDDERIVARSSLPGGESGVLGSPFYANLLGPWLTNDSHPLRHARRTFARLPLERVKFEPGPTG